MARHDGGLTNEERAALQPHFDRPGTPSAPVVLPVVARLRELVTNLKDSIDQQVALTDASTQGGQSVGRSPRMQRSMALELQKRVAEVDAVLAACPGEKLREGIEKLALEQHMVLDGEYGCNGLTCPGVQKLIAFAERVAALTLSEGTRTWQPIDTAPKDGTPFIAANRMDAFRAFYRTEEDYQCWVVEDTGQAIGTLKYPPTHWTSLPPKGTQP